MAKSIMIQGTGSGVGKSFVAAGLLRVLKERGFRAAPFKAQNMSNNSFIAREGGEIARAQAMQAECAGLEPSVHMNPILLKPHRDDGSQVIVQGKSVGHMTVRQYKQFGIKAMARVRDSYKKLAAAHDVIVIEGAGSPAEVNLRRFDFVNMRTARLARAPVLLVGDIDRGGVFAWLYGTYRLLAPEDRKRIKGFIINKFRGDASLLRPGLDFLERTTGVPVLGVIPYLEGLSLDEEDSQGLKREARNGGLLDIAVLAFPRISNFTDFTPLAHEPHIRVRYVSAPDEWGTPHLVVLPGTKSTVADLAWLRDRGFGAHLKHHAARGGFIFGICGGFQMLGKSIRDPKRVEGKEKRVEGLGLLPVETVFGGEKVTKRIRGRVKIRVGRTLVSAEVEGYEIHMGRTTPAGDRNSGCIYGRGRIFGTYLHGIFENDAFRRQFLQALARSAGTGRQVQAATRRLVESAPPRGRGRQVRAAGRGLTTSARPAGTGSSGYRYAELKEENYKRLAETLKRSLNIARLCSLIS